MRCSPTAPAICGSRWTMANWCERLLRLHTSLLTGSDRIATARFVLQADGTVTFAVSDYDPTLPLVIDPVLVYSTYFGGSFYDPGLGLLGDRRTRWQSIARAIPTSRAEPRRRFPHGQLVRRRSERPDHVSVLRRPRRLRDQAGSQWRADFLDVPGRLARHSRIRHAKALRSPWTPRGVSGWVARRTRRASPRWTRRRSRSTANPFREFGAFLTQFTPDGSAIVYSTIFPGNIRIEDIALNGDGTVYAAGNHDVAAGFVLRFDPTGAAVLGKIPRWVAWVASQSTILGQIYIGGSTSSPQFPTKNALYSGPSRFRPAGSCGRLDS